MSEEPKPSAFEIASALPPLLQREASARHLSAVGAVASLWSNFEITIDTYSLELGRLPRQAGYCLTSQIAGSGRKLDAYVAIARLRGADKFASTLEQFLKDTAALAERRNRVVHDPWFFFEIGSEAFARRLEITARRKLRQTLVPVGVVEIIGLAGEIIQHMERFALLHDQILGVANT
jgi:hypothetical protein